MLIALNLKILINSKDIMKVKERRALNASAENYGIKNATAHWNLSSEELHKLLLI